MERCSHQPERLAVILAAVLLPGLLASAAPAQEELQPAVVMTVDQQLPPAPVVRETDLPAATLWEAPQTPAPAASAPIAEAGEDFELVFIGWHAVYTNTVHFLHGRLRLGTRQVHTVLNDESRSVSNSFLGSITELEAENDYAPTRFYAQWMIIPYAGLELTTEHLRAKTTTYWDGHSDGTFDLSGPLVALFVQYPNPTRFQPSLGVGYAFLSATFEHEASWRYNSGVVQTLDVEDTRGYYFYAACDIAIRHGWSANVYLRHMRTEVDAHYYISLPNGTVIDDRGNTTFPMNNMTFGLGIQYAF